MMDGMIDFLCMGVIPIVFVMLIFQRKSIKKSPKKENDDVKKITDFIDKAITGCDIEYRKTIKADLLIIKITNLFTGDIVSYDFKIINDNICFYSSNNRYEIATEKLFFDEMMSQAQETIGG